MTLETAYYATQILAVVLILVSLGFVGLQLRQANRLARADMTQRSIDRFFPPMEIMAQNPDLALAYNKVLKGETKIAEATQAQLNWFFSLMIQAHVGSWTIEYQGLVDERTIDARNNTIVRMIAAPYFHAEWERTKRRGIFPPEYTKFVDAKLAARQS